MTNLIDGHQKTPKVGETITLPKHLWMKDLILTDGKIVIQEVDEPDAKVWGLNNTLCYFFEDLFWDEEKQTWLFDLYQ